MRHASKACSQGVLGTDGAIASRTTGINATIKDLDRQRDVLDRRLAQIEQRYRKQFTALDTAHEQHDRHQHLPHSAAAAAPTAAELERVRPAPNQISLQESNAMNAVAGRAVDTYTRLEVETGVAAAIAAEARGHALRGRDQGRVERAGGARAR